MIPPRARINLCRISVSPIVGLVNNLRGVSISEREVSSRDRFDRCSGFWQNASEMSQIAVERDAHWNVGVRRDAVALAVLPHSEYRRIGAA